MSGRDDTGVVVYPPSSVAGLAAIRYCIVPDESDEEPDERADA